MWIFVQQGFGSQKYPGRAVTALECALLQEGLLEGMKLSFVSKTLYSQDFFMPGIQC